MGKYMRKAKTTRELGVVDLSLGVRTRAKTLALQRQARLPAAPPPPPAQARAQAQPPQQPPSPQGAGYLQLRSRRLRKPPILVDYSSSRRQRHAQNKEAQQEQKQQNPTRNSKPGSRAARVGSTEPKGSSGQGVETGNAESKEEEIEENNCDDENNNGGGGGGGNEEMEIDDDNEGKDLGLEASFGDNVLDIEDCERSTRESTPCSLIRDPESVQTPGSTTRRTSSAEANRRLQNSMRRHIPTAHEMDQFFAGAEEEQQKRFIEKYNFDPVSEKPLPGRYEWEKVDHSKALCSMRTNLPANSQLKEFQK